MTADLCRGALAPPSWLCYCKAMIGSQSGNTEAALFSSSRAESVPIKGGPRQDRGAEERGKRGRSGGGKHGDGILNRNILPGTPSSQTLNIFRLAWPSKRSQGLLQTHLRVLKVLLHCFPQIFPQLPALLKQLQTNFNPNPS